MDGKMPTFWVQCGPKYKKSPQCGPKATFADLFGNTAFKVYIFIGENPGNPDFTPPLSYKKKQVLNILIFGAENKEYL